MEPDCQMILNFHGIGTPHAGVDASERPYWISERMFRDILDMTSQRPDFEKILWTFDDGNLSDLFIGAPALAERGRRGSFFILTGRFGDANYLDHDQTRALLALGMEVGLHGRDHVDWRQLSSAQLEAETIDARANLASVIGQPVDQVAVPFGAYNRKVIAHLRHCGFGRINTSDGGPSRRNQRIWSRTSIRRDMSLERISQLINDQLPPQRKLKRYVSTTLRRYLL